MPCDFDNGFVRSLCLPGLLLRLWSAKAWQLVQRRPKGTEHWTLYTAPTMTGRLSAMGNLQASISSGPLWIHPESRPDGVVYRGRLLLVDRECVSYCEDFLMPFKTSGRGVVIGETTAGTYAQTVSVDLGMGMNVLIAATAEHFPDGSTFEGKGIEPDYTIAATPDGLRNGRDPAMEKALQLAASH
jgi:hypothetical protein